MRDEDKEYYKNIEELNDLGEHVEETSPNVPELLLRDMESCLQLFGTDDGTLVLQEHWCTFYKAVGNQQQELKHRRIQSGYLRSLLAEEFQVPGIDQDYLNRVEERIVFLQKKLD